MPQCAEKKFFFISKLCMSRKNAFIANQKNSLAETLRTSLKVVFTYKNFFCTCLSSLFAKIPIFTNQKVFFCSKLYELSSKAAFLRTKSLLFAQAFSRCPQKIPIFTNQKPFFRTNLSLFPPKAILFHPPLPIPTTLNLLFAKNVAVLLQFALILCCKAGASHRFKSLPAIPGEVAAFRKTGYLMKAGHFRKITYRPAI